jgi:hypothetical protein
VASRSGRIKYPRLVSVGKSECSVSHGRLPRTMKLISAGIDRTEWYGTSTGPSARVVVLSPSGMGVSRRRMKNKFCALLKLAS